MRVRYVLEETVHNGSGRLRITGQLTEAEAETHLWIQHQPYAAFRLAGGRPRLYSAPA